MFKQATLAVLFLFALSALATPGRLAPLQVATDPSQRVPGEYLVLLVDDLTGPLFELQVATLQSLADAARDGSALKHVFSIDADGSRLLLFKLSSTSLYKIRAHPSVALVEENQSIYMNRVCYTQKVTAELSKRLLACPWTEIYTSAHFVDVSVREPNTGKWGTVKLLKYLDGFYIALPTERNSVSSYKCPTRYQSTMSDIVTTWFAIRFDPATFTVNTGDYTFVKTTGYNAHHKDMGPDAATHVPFATCFGCEAPSRNDGHAVVDLRGTPFTVIDHFKYAGWLAYGTWTYSNNAQLVDLTGGGYCGWTAPVKAADNENLACNGGWHLQLGLL